MSTEQIHAVVVDALAAIAPDVDPTAVDADLHDELGLDSMDMLNLTDLVVARSGVQIPDRELASLRTLRRIEEFLAAHTV